MKKFLLSLFAVLAASTAFAVTETLTVSNFGASGTSYSEYDDYTSATTNVIYHAYIAVNSNSNFQFNSSKAGSGVYSKANPDGKIIKSISVTVASGNKTMEVYGSTTAYDSTTSNPSGDLIDELAATGVVDFDPGKGYQYFYIKSKSGVIYVSSIEIEYQDKADPRTYVTLSFPENLYTAFLGEEFTSPVLSCSEETAASVVKYESSDETVATIDENGNVTILDDGATTIKAYIPEDNEDYYSNTATYDLVVKDPNALESVISTEFFDSKTSGYNYYDKEDVLTGVEYTAVYFLNSGDMQFNLSNAGSGIAVCKISPNYNIASINIEFSTPGTGVKVYKSNTAFAKHTSTSTAISVDGATQVGDTYTADATVAIGTGAFAIVPAGSGVIKIKKVTVTYAKVVGDDGSEMFRCESFVNQMINRDEMVEIVLPDDAPEITYTSSDSEIAAVEDGFIMAYKPGTAVITASWEAVPGKWLAGSDEFTINVKYATLAEVIADAKDNSTGFLKLGQTYVGNFPVVVGSDNGNYNYVTDGTAWALFYVNHNHGEGAVLEAGWSATLSEYHGLLEFTNVKHDDIVDQNGDFTIKEYTDLTLSEDVVNEVLVLKDVTFKAATPEASGNFFEGHFNGQTVKFNNLFELNTVEAGSYDVEGAVSYYDGEIRFYPTEYKALEATATPSHVDGEYNTIYEENETGVEVKFTNVEEGAHIYYRHGGENPDHTNVFTEAPAAAPYKVVSDVDTEYTYNHTTHPLTFKGEPISVKYYAKAPGKAPSEIKELNLDENGSTTGIENIAADTVDCAVEYFNLQGQRVDNPSTGLYIMRQGSKVQKVVVK